MQQKKTTQFKYIFNLIIFKYFLKVYWDINFRFMASLLSDTYFMQPSTRQWKMWK